MNEVKSITTSTENLTENKELRDKCISRVEVLDKVKKLFLIPQIEMMTIRQIAEFYEVDVNTAKLCYQRNAKEIDEDGTIVKKPLDFAKISKGTSCTFRKQAAVNIFEFDNVQIVVSNRGLRCFSKRAVLRFGMLLRDSKVAQEVRTQLLNIVEKSDDSAKVESIETEEILMKGLIDAYGSGDCDLMLSAAAKYNAFKTRYVTEIERKLAESEDKNKTLSADNDILAGHILEWDNRKSANSLVRLMAKEMKIPYQCVWGIIYKELYYKHGISLKQRGDMKPPYIAKLRDDEWGYFCKSAAAILESNNISPSKLFELAKIRE